MDAPLSKQKRFVDWLTQHSASFQKLQFREDNEGCGSVYASTDIAEDEVFLTIPFSPLVLTDGLARKALPDSAQSLDGRTALTLFLMQQRLLKENAFFQPYLDMVPDKIHTALEFDDQDLEHLRGTNAYLTVKELQQKLRQKFNDTMRIVGGELKEQDGYTWEKFLWAETVLSSRAFPAHLFGGGVEGEIVLIPLADTLNHKSRHKATWIKTQQGLEMSGAAASKGDQLFNNYGPKSNEELLTGYGFCIEDNKDDMVTLKTNFSRDPDQERKSAILKQLGITDETIHYLQMDSVPELLLVAMRVMAMNPAETGYYFDLMEQQEQDGTENEEETLKGREQRLQDRNRRTALVLTKELQFIGLRNEFAMLDLIDMLLSTKARGILEWDAQLSAPQNQAQEFAQIYRRGQREILKSCADIIRGMFSVLLEESQSSNMNMERAAFIGSNVQQGALVQAERRPKSSDTYCDAYFKVKAHDEARSMSELKQEAIQQVLLTASSIMNEQREGVFGEALMSAFPGHGWGEKDGGVEEDEELDEETEMAVQMEQDAILTCFLIFESRYPEHFKRFITAAKKFDYSSQLDEDMRDDVQDLHQSLQDTLEATDPEKFDFQSTFTAKAFLWATGLLETLSLSLHIDGDLVSGILAPRDAAPGS
ncbi:hypothetical protein KVV02_005073 [Mortierella alpina]|uniref:Rubisco LSMT substrate-binding domain-containing protein n=1 Tax=Mortierella alpina TaxID=64518 RepID=A0A9P8CW52_MORAP|nr:hypothetical protein KVV02_005073 [Mortierella alpina]